MSENIAELNLIQLRLALRQAALPADQQNAGLKGFDVPFEVADDLSNWTAWVLQSTDVELIHEQRSSLLALDARTDQMSGPANAHLWTEDALRSRPEWEEIRQQARKILESFEWPLEDTDDPDVNVLRSKS